MNIGVTKSTLEEVEPFRELFLKESSFQFVYNKCHGAGWSDVYSFFYDGATVGYGSVWGKDRREDRDEIFECYLLPPFRKFANLFFPEFIARSGAPFIKCQTNDVFLAAMLYEHAKNIIAEAILFEDDFQTDFFIEGAVFRKGNNDSKEEPEYLIELEGQMVATGGFVYNYNFPFIDMYYEVREPFRRRGLASLFVQELKREAYRMKRVPAARCNIHNLPSKYTLLKAGMKTCGFLLTGELK